MKRRQQQISRISLVNAFFALWIRRARVQLVLTGWLVPDRIRGIVSRLRSDFPTVRVIVTTVACAAIVVPSVLYQAERSKRLEMTRAYQYLSTSSSTEIATLSRSLEGLLVEQDDLRSLLLRAGYAVVSDDQLSIRLIATGYSSCRWETDDTPFITASNTRTRTGIVALSRDLIDRYNPEAPFSFGDAVHISGLGDFIVEDSMHWRWRRRVDLWFPSKREARRFGVRGVTVSMPIFRPSGEAAEAADRVADVSAATGYAAGSKLPQ
jgi:3D (Asp-Asp-Asp) domain-containing protein